MLQKIREIYKMDKYLKDHPEKNNLRSRRIIALIAALGFAMMSVLNILVKSELMLISTAVSSVVCLIGAGIGKITRSDLPVQISFYIILILLFPFYVYIGGNNGFACLWMIIACYLTTYFIDLTVGLCINVFYLIAVIVLFAGAIPGFHKEAYTEVFLLRFPAFYAINMIFSTYFVVTIRVYQYKMVMKQKEIQEISITDLNTALYNRNGYIEHSKNFANEKPKNIAYIYMDANGLHEINNKLGHEAGDRFLRAIADTSKKYFPEQRVYRLGGDEFLIVAMNQSKEKTEKAMEKIRTDLEAVGWHVAQGLDYQEGEFFVESMLKTSNARMLENKAAFYTSLENDRRAR